MKNKRTPGLDELMIVNPGGLGEDAFFLGGDGMLYQVQGLGGGGESLGPGQFLLGEDGRLYQVQGFDAAIPDQAGEDSGFALAGDDDEFGRYLLGADGTLYEVAAD